MSHSKLATQLAMLLSSYSKRLKAKKLVEKKCQPNDIESGSMESELLIAEQEELREKQWATEAWCAHGSSERRNKKRI